MNGENSNEDGMFLKPRRRRSLDDNDGITDENARIIDESDFIMTFLNNRKFDSSVSSITVPNRSKYSSTVFFCKM